MRITPLDVRKQEFKRGMRGYDNYEVRAFLSTLADEYEAVLVDNKQLRERVLEQDEKLAEYRNLEQTLRDTLMTAERVTQDAKETARREGKVLVQEAKQRVQQVLAEAREQLNEMRREALAVHREKEAYLGRFRSLAEAQIHFVEQHHSDFQDLDGRLLEQADAMPSREPQGPITGQPETSAAEISAPAARLDGGRDQWREYAIESGEEDDKIEPTDAEHIAEVVQEVDQPAPSPSPVPLSMVPKPAAEPSEDTQPA